MRARPLLLGHRGARREAPENTLEAFELCLQHGCDGFEFDARLCADGKSIICHDPRLRGKAVAKTPSPDLSAPCLEDVFREFASRAFLDIELKVGGLERIVAELIRESPPAKGYYVSSFLPEVIEALAAVDANLRLGLICDSRKQLSRWQSLPLQALFLHHSLIEAQVIQELKAAKKAVFAWTVNDSGVMRRFANMGLDGIISDDTELLVRTLGADALDSGANQKR